MPEVKPTWKQQYGGKILAAVVALVAAGLGALTTYLGQPTPAPVVIEVPVVPPPEPTYGHGWVSDPEEVASVVAMLPIKAFADTPAGMTQDPLPPAVYGWQSFDKLGKPAPVKNQGGVGSCVSHGTNTAVEYTLAAEVVRRKGAASEWSRFTEEATYGGSRVEIGGGRIRGDGSIGAWAAQFVTKWGMVPRKKYDSTDLTTYSESRCRQWGQSGVPDEFETVAKKFPVKSTTQVKVWEEAKTAMAQGYYVAVCSNQGFAMQRDANGVCRPSGSWAHCMALTGYHTEAGKEYGHITNSWGADAHTGPVGWGNPPPDGFWCEWTTVDRMLKQGDSWAFSGVTGFPARKLDWFTRAEPAFHPFARPEFALAP